VRNLHHDLETVEALGLGRLDFGRETLDQVLVDNTVGLKGSVELDEEGKRRDLQQRRRQGRAQ
jgi:hypothetical protein